MSRVLQLLSPCVGRRRQRWPVRLYRLTLSALLVLAGLLLAAVGQPGPAALAFAQSATTEPDSAALKREQDVLFQRVLANPADLDASFRHAEVSAALGDFEAAIGSLERILFYNPQLPHVMIELGVLYFRLGSYQMARTYFTNAISGSDVPPEMRAKVEPYLAEIAKRLNPVLTTGFAQTGVRYQSNANAGPNGGLVRALGVEATLDRKFVQQSDWNWFAQGVVRNIIDFGNQRGDAWETTLGTYLSRYQTFSRLDTELVDVRTGPRLALFPETASGWSVRPFVGFVGVRLGGEPYLTTQVAGASIAWIPAPGWTVEGGYEYVRRDFSNTDDYPTADLQTGDQDVGFLFASGPLGWGWRWFLRGAVADNDARVAWQSYWSKAIDLSLVYNFPLHGRLVTVTPYAGYYEYDYRGPDPFVDPDVTREDRVARVGLGLDFEVWRHVGLGVRVQYSKTDSTLPNYKTDNLSVYGGPTVRF